MSHPILTQSQATQTEPTLTETEPAPVSCPSVQKPDPDAIKELKKDIQQKDRTIIGLNASYEKLEKAKDKQIKELQSQVRELVKRPLKPTNHKGTQTDELTQILDTLIKDIQDLNNSL